MKKKDIFEVTTSSTTTTKNFCNFSERDFFKEPFAEEELRELTQLASVTEVFSWRSPTAKKLGENLGTSDDGGLIGLMLEEPRLIRRPMIQIGSKLIIGASQKDVLESFLS